MRQSILSKRPALMIVEGAVNEIVPRLIAHLNLKKRKRQKINQMYEEDDALILQGNAATGTAQ